MLRIHGLPHFPGLPIKVSAWREARQSKAWGVFGDFLAAYPLLRESSEPEVKSASNCFIGVLTSRDRPLPQSSLAMPLPKVFN
jgi:hypothetical protein